MEAWAEHFVSVWQKNRVVIAETVLEAVKRNPYLPVKDYALDDIQQIFDGTLAMMTERLIGESTDMWDNYIDTIIVGILSQGQPLSALVGQVTMNGMLVHQLLVPLAQKKYRPQISEFLIHWFISANIAIVKVGASIGNVS